MPQQLTPEILAEKLCRQLELSIVDNAEVVSGLIREALTNLRDAAVAETKAACLVIAEEEAERCTTIGVTTGHQIALQIAGRIRREAVGHSGGYSGLLTRRSKI